MNASESGTRCTELGKSTNIAHVCGNMSGVSEMPFAFKDTYNPKVLVEEEEYY